MKYKGVFFDFDYTLGDATESILAGFTHAFCSMGHPAPEREAVRRTVGMQVADAYTQMTGDGDEARRNEFYSLFHPVARQLQAQGKVELFPGAVELLEALKSCGIATALISTKNTSSLENILMQKALSDQFAYVVGGDKVARPKPDPEGLLWTLGQSGLRADEVLYCGDTVIDAETAQRAGADFCAVLNGTTGAEAFECYPCVYIAQDLWNLKNWLDI